MKMSRTKGGQIQLLEKMILRGQGSKMLKRLEPPGGFEPPTY